MISFIIRTCYARRGCLEYAIKSVLQQKYNGEIEIVIVENGSNKLESWLSEHSLPSNISLSLYQSDKADRCEAGNIGLESAKGEYACFLDDDDEVYPNYCQAMLDAFKQDSSIDAVCALAHEVKSSIKSHTPFEFTDYETYLQYNREFTRESLWVSNYLPIQSVLFKRSLYTAHGGFDHSLEVLEDWDLWVRYSTNNKFQSISDITSKYRVPDDDSKRIEREDAFRQYYYQAVEKQKTLSTSVNKESYCNIVSELLVRYKGLKLLYRLKLVSYEKLCRVECGKFSEVESELLETSPRDAIDCAKKQISKNCLIKFITLSEHRAKIKIRRLITLLRSCKAKL